MSHMTSPEIETKRLILKTMSKDFILDKLSNQKSGLEKGGLVIEDKQWRHCEILDALPYLIENEESFFSTGYGPWLIIVKQSNEVIGNCGCHDLPNQNDEVEIGYEIHSNQRMRGYGYEAISAYTNWLINEKKISTIKADCLRDNIGSIKILQKLKMKEIMRDDQYYYFKIEVPNRNGESYALYRSDKVVSTQDIARKS